MTPQPQPPTPIPTLATAPEDGPEHWLRQCWIEGVTAAWGTQLSALGARAVGEGSDADIRAGMQAFTALAALGRGDYDLADEVLAPPAASSSPSVRLLDSAARLYRACGDAERDPQRAVVAMNALNDARRAASADDSPEARTARGYAGLALGEALLMVGDVGAARHQLGLVIEEGQAPPVLLTWVRCILGGLEQAVGRADLALEHLQAAVRGSTGLAAEGHLTRLLLCGVMLGNDVRYGLALFEEFTTQRREAGAPRGHGAVARLYQLLATLITAMPGSDGSQGTPLGLPQRALVRDLLRTLQARHYSAGWFLLLTGLCSGGLRAAGDHCEAYSVLVHAGATLRCRRMDGAAELCDRQIDAMRAQLGVDAFEALLTEARHRRQLFLSYVGTREAS